VIVKCLLPRFVSLARLSRRELPKTNCAYRTPEPSEVRDFLSLSATKWGEGWGEVVRLIFKGVPISKQYLKNLPITWNRPQSEPDS
jgi:hypothetical protein